MKKNDFLALITLVAALGGATGVLALMYPLGDPTITDLFSPASPTPVVATNTATPTAPATKTATASPSPATSWQVCTGLQDGHLHVRASAGHQSPILGTLPESVLITPSGQREGGWFEISAPLVGWVNSKFLCGGSP